MVHIGWNPGTKRWEYVDVRFAFGLSTAAPDTLHGTEAPAPELSPGFTVHFEQDPVQWCKEFDQLTMAELFTGACHG
jgi:hypothetical protein